MTLAAINTLLFCVVNVSTLKMSPKPQAMTAKLFYYSSYFAQAFVFAVFISLFGLVVASLIHVADAFITVCAFINFLCVMFSFVNSMVMYKYRFYVNRDLVRLVFGKGASEVVQVHPLEYLIFGSAFAIVLTICFGLQFLSWHISTYSSVSAVAQYGCLLFAILYIINQFSCIILSVKKSMSILQYTSKIYLYDTLSLCQLFKYCGFIKNKLYQALNQESDMRYPLQPLQTSDNTEPLNVMIIVVDSLRFDAVTAETMPNVFQFSNNAATFNKHFSGGNTTQPGIFSVFYGIPPTYWKATQHNHVPPAMITSMQKQNYQMGIFGSATLENPPFHRNVFCSIPNLQTFSDGNNPLERDKNITESMIQFIQQRNKQKPLFGFLFYDSPHGYYAIPNMPPHFTPTKCMNHITVNNNSDPKPLKNLYLCAVYETDALIKRVLDTLKEQGLLENTIVMITGDHGQEFNDLNKNYWEHPSNFARFQTKVPMIVHHPNYPVAQHNYFTTHYDIVPTIMNDALGITNPIRDYGVGHHLFQENTVPFTLMANYTHYALMDRDQIVEIQKSGRYQITDHDMNHQENAALDANTLEKVIEHIRRYNIT